MTLYVAFLRGINVGGSNIIPMDELRALFCQTGLTNIRTYIQSGNVIFISEASEKNLIRKLEEALLRKAGKSVPVVIRTGKELADLVWHNPFPGAKPAQVGVMLFAAPVPADFMSGVSTAGREEVKIAAREVYIHYPDGMGRSKLKLPKSAREGTVRNMNTLSRLVELSETLSAS